MSKIKIITDSASDIPYELEKELGIQILSFPIAVGNESYFERVDFTNEQFYDILENEPNIPTTAQITQLRFEEAFMEHYQNGVSDIILVTISSTGSTTYESALMARNAFFAANPETQSNFHIHVIDSLTYSLGYGYPVIEAAKKAGNNACAEDIVAYLEDWFSCVEIFLAPYTLKFARKSGRIKAASAFMGELAGLRPIIHMIDGKTKILEKVRGDKAVVPKLVDLAFASMVPQTPYMVVRGSLDGFPDDLIKEMTKKSGAEPTMFGYAGAAVTINAGPRMVAIVFRGKPRQSKHNYI